MKQIATEAIVLSRIDFGEAGRILTLLTKDYGKVSVLAKGVRKPKSKLAGGVELFTIADIVYIEGKSDIKTLVSAQLKTNYAHISTDIDRSMVAYDVLKYAHLYTESVCEDSYFLLVKDVLTSLADKEADLNAIWVWFGIHLLEISGHAINTTTDARDATLIATDRFQFDYQSMAFLPIAGAPYTAAHIKFLRVCQRSPLKELKKVGGIKNVAHECTKLLTDCMKYSN